MQHVRRTPRLRIAGRVAAVLAVGVLALAGCRSDPAVAAYVGSTSYGQDQVEQIAAQAHTRLQELADGQAAAGGAPAQRVDPPVTAQQVVAALVSRDVLKSLAQRAGIRPVAVEADQVAQQVRVPADTDYVRLVAEKDGYRLALMQRAGSVRPTQADLREVYQNLVTASGGSFRDTSFEEFTSTLAPQDSELVGRSAAVRKQIAEEATRLDVTINPRYAPAVLSLVDVTDPQGTVHSLLGVPLDVHETGVVDLS